VKPIAQMEPSLSPTQALNEAWRCLQCFDAPCVQGCPAGIVIPRFIRMIRSGNPRGAAEVVRAANPMAASCGLACPDEQLCASACVRARIDAPVAIRRLHRYATEIEEALRPRARTDPAAVGARVAVVGAGPAGLSCASELRRLGLEPILFEGRDRIGGVLTSTIPLYRFPESAVTSDAAFAIGGTGRKKSTRDGRTEVRLGARVDSVADLAAEYDAVFLSTGLGAPGPAIAGAERRGATTAEEFLERCRRALYRIRIVPDVAVIGGGNVAIDAAMAALRCGAARVHVLYRRTRAEMPAWEREVLEAERAGVIFHFLVAPDALVGPRGRLEGIRLRRVVLGAPDASGRPTPAPIPGSEFILPCRAAILALGRRVDRAPLGDLPLTPDGVLRTHPQTGRVRGNVYAGGDAAGREQTIVAAVRDGKRAARAIAAALGAGA
jgi:glutamate synthase (NADPH/NADH) small chain